MAVEAGGEFVEDFAEGEDIGGGRAGAFGRDVALGADESGGGGGGGDEADVGEFGAAADEDEVGGFDVAMDEAAGVEGGEGAGEIGAEGDDLIGGEAAAAGAEFGTCQAAQCVGSGQTCSLGGTSCCTGLSCLNSQLQVCGSTGACTCTVPIN